MFTYTVYTRTHCQVIVVHQIHTAIWERQDLQDYRKSNISIPYLFKQEHPQKYKLQTEEQLVSIPCVGGKKYYNHIEERKARGMNWQIEA